MFVSHLICLFFIKIKESCFPQLHVDHLLMDYSLTLYSLNGFVELKHKISLKESDLTHWQYLFIVTKWSEIITMS